MQQHLKIVQSHQRTEWFLFWSGGHVYPQITSNAPRKHFIKVISLVERNCTVVLTVLADANLPLTVTRTHMQKQCVVFCDERQLQSFIRRVKKTNENLMNWHENRLIRGTWVLLSHAKTSIIVLFMFKDLNKHLSLKLPCQRHCVLVLFI